MELTNRQIWEAQQAITALISLTPAPTVEVAFKLARNGRKIEAAMQDVVATRNTLRAQYAGTWVDDNGKEHEGILPEHEEQWEADLDELLTQVTDVDIRPISIQELRRCEEARDGFQIPTSAIFAASFMFELDGGDHDEPTA